MTTDLVGENARIKKLEEILKACAHIFQRLGFQNMAGISGLSGRQIVFENQIISPDITFNLTVVNLADSTKINSKTFNFECNVFPGHTSPIRLQDREIKTLKLQLVEEQKYHQLQLQLYFLSPLNYASEDLIYRIKAEKLASGIKIITGFPWLTPQLHMSDDAALELVNQIDKLLPL